MLSALLAREVIPRVLAAIQRCNCSRTSTRHCGGGGDKQKKQHEYLHCLKPQYPLDCPMISAGFCAALAIVVCVCDRLAYAAPAADLVVSLPNVTGPFPSKHYSGYLAALNGSFLHYYLVESMEVDPLRAPLVLWMNGGPGCSSMDGWGYELGPFHFNSYGAEGPQVTWNPYTYARIANLVFLEAPPGVGFSYRLDGNYNISDTLNAENNFAAVLSLFEKFPEFLNNSFLVAGESYGGVYVPTLVEQILNHNDVVRSTSRGTKIRLSGMMVGNGITDANYDDNVLESTLPFAFGHGLISQEIRDEVTAACLANETGPKCYDAQGQMWEAIQYNNIYGVYYKCFALPRESWKYVPMLRRRLAWEARRRFGTDDVSVVIAAANNGSIPPSPHGGDVPCIDSRVMEAYLNNDTVKASLHVQQSLVFHICYSLNYTSNLNSVVHVYRRLLDLKIPTLVYNGDIDMCVPYTGTQGWIASMQLNMTTKFRPWLFHDASYVFGPQIGGYATGYEEGNLLWFVRVLGSGHMVPQFRPAAAFDMFARFINGTGF